MQTNSWNSQQKCKQTAESTYWTVNQDVQDGDEPHANVAKVDGQVVVPIGIIGIFFKYEFFRETLVEIHVLSVKFSVIPMLRTHSIGELTDAFAKVFGLQE